MGMTIGCVTNLNLYFIGEITGMRKAWFCYELGAKGPTPVIHYDNLPNHKNPLNPKVIQTHELDDRWDREMDEIVSSFEYLKMMFPYVGEHYNSEKTFILTE